MISLKRLRGIRNRLALVVLGCSAIACSSIGVPAGIEPISDFDVERYLGTWYEIARMENRFERGLEAVSATYSLKDNGQVRVINRGWKTADDKWVQAEGRAKFVRSSDVGHLAVSFFGPFFGSYVIFELDEDYENVWVSGNDRSTLWYLSRSPEADPAAVARFRERAASLGFDLSGVIDVDQTRNREASAPRLQ